MGWIGVAHLSSKVKAVILGGGKGKRLRPLTYYFQKVMIPIGSKQKPLLEYIVRLLKHHGFKDILLLVGYKYEQVINYFEDGSRFDVHIDYVIDDPKYTGTGGALYNAIKLGKLNDVEDIVVYYGDILSDIDLTNMYKYHRDKKADITVAIASKYQIPVGLVETNNEQRILSIIEKPWLPLKVTIGILMMSKNAFKYIDELAKEKMKDATTLKLDIMGEIIPFVIEKGGNVYAYIHSGVWLDVGSTEKYEKLDNKLVDRLFERLSN